LQIENVRFLANDKGILQLNLKCTVHSKLMSKAVNAQVFHSFTTAVDVRDGAVLDVLLAAVDVGRAVLGVLLAAVDVQDEAEGGHAVLDGLVAAVNVGRAVLGVLLAAVDVRDEAEGGQSVLDGRRTAAFRPRGLSRIQLAQQQHCSSHWHSGSGPLLEQHMFIDFIPCCYSGSSREIERVPLVYTFVAGIKKPYFQVFSI
jgi:hypothetical protein